MKFDFEKTILVTHKGCTDGSMCAVAFLFAGGKKENIRYVAAGTLEKFIKDETELMNSDKFLLFADLGFNDVSYMERLQRRGNFLLVDHHLTSLQLAGQANVYATDQACGSLLLSEVLGITTKGEDWQLNLAAIGSGPKSRADDSSGGPLVRLFLLYNLLLLADDFDRWILKDPKSDRLVLLSTFYGQERFVQKIVEHDYVFTKEENELIDILKQKRDEEIAKALNRVKLQTIFYEERSMLIAYAVTSNKNVSQLLQRMLEAFPTADISVQLNMEQMTASVRSRPDGPDVAKFCSKFGGGGHKHAAGHKLSENMLDDIITMVH